MGANVAFERAQLRLMLGFVRTANGDQRGRGAFPFDQPRLGVGGQRFPVRGHQKHAARSGQRGGVAASEGFGQAFGFLKGGERRVAKQFEKRAVEEERLFVAHHEHADRQNVDEPADRFRRLHRIRRGLRLGRTFRDRFRRGLGGSGRADSGAELARDFAEGVAFLRAQRHAFFFTGRFGFVG